MIFSPEEVAQGWADPERSTALAQSRAEGGGEGY
jgi:hypothetical protein